MKSAHWERHEAELRLWLADTAIEDTDAGALHEWIEALLEGRPYILIDVYETEQWVRDFAERHHLPLGLWGEKQRKVGLFGCRHPERKYGMFGCTDPAVLAAHQADGGFLSWISGLDVPVFDTEAAMLSRLAAWDGQPFEAVRRDQSLLQFAMTTYADATCLILTPGQVTRERLLAAAVRVAARLGYAWEPLPARDTTP